MVKKEPVSQLKYTSIKFISTIGGGKIYMLVGSNALLPVATSLC